MTEQTINLSFLDVLVEEYLFQQGVKDSANEDVSEKLLQWKKKRDLIREIEHLILSGRIRDAWEALKGVDNSAFSSILNENLKLQLRFHKQQFIEFLRKGEEISAIEYCRTEFAPFALASFPEAYKEYKNTLLLLLYHKLDFINGSETVDNPSLAKRLSPLKSDWAPDTLHKLASMINSTLSVCLDMANYESSLSLIIRYLITVHNVYHAIVGSQSQYQEIESLLMPELASMPLSKEGFHNFPEDSIQALAQAVGISRQESVESLKHSDGCLERALKQQLCRIRINENLFDKLAIE